MNNDNGTDEDKLKGVGNRIEDALTKAEETEPIDPVVKSGKYAYTVMTTSGNVFVSSDLESVPDTFPIRVDGEFIVFPEATIRTSSITAIVAGWVDDDDGDDDDEDPVLDIPDKPQSKRRRQRSW